MIIRLPFLYRRSTLATASRPLLSPFALRNGNGNLLQFLALYSSCLSAALTSSSFLDELRGRIEALFVHPCSMHSHPLQTQNTNEWFLGTSYLANETRSAALIPASVNFYRTCDQFYHYAVHSCQ